MLDYNNILKKNMLNVLIDILNNIKNKKYFKSEILTSEDQKFLFDNVKEIHTYKGNHTVPPYYSNIAFLKKR